MGWYGRLGATGGISASYSSCSNAVSGGGCVNGYAELGLIAKAASRIGSLEVGARGGINFRTSICVSFKLKGGDVYPCVLVFGLVQKFGLLEK